MIDLTPAFKAAYRKDTRWEASSVQGVLETLSRSLPRGVVDWEPGDEEWGRVLEGDEVRALIYSRAPLVILVHPLTKPMGMTPLDLVVVEVESVDAESYCVDKLWLESVLGRQLTDNVSYDKLSIMGLWWATVA